MKKFSLLLMFSLILVFAAACGNSDEEANASKNTETVSGKIVVGGSSALQPLAAAAAEQFMDKNADAEITVQGGGSGTGLSEVSKGNFDIGNSDVFAEEKLDADKAKELVDHKVAVVGMTAAVNPEAGVTNLSQADLIKVFTGEVKNWKEVGGNDVEITLVNRPEGSGTRATFEKYALNGATPAEGIQEDSSNRVKEIVADTPGAIGYEAFSYFTDDSIVKLSINGVEATDENVQSGDFPVWAYEHAFTKGEATGVAKAFLDYMMSDEVQNSLVPEQGYIAASKMQVERDASGKTTKGGKEVKAEAPKASGKIVVGGSSALQPLAAAAAEMFMTENQDAEIQVQGGGSGTGLSEVSKGNFDIGNSDVFAEEKLDAAKAKELVDHKVAVVGMTAAVNPEAGVSNLTQADLIKVFTGEVKNWKEVGGNDVKITLVNRPDGSGTRATFVKYALKGATPAEGIQEDSSNRVKQIVADTPGAIGYEAFSYFTDDSIVKLAIDGVEATDENVQAGKFPVWAYEHMFTKGDATDLEKAFIDYMMSGTVQDSLVPEQGYISSAKMQVERDATGKTTAK